MDNKILIEALNSIDEVKRFKIITITDDELADYNAMLAYDHGDFESINREES